MSTVIALSWQEHIEPVEYSAVAAAAYRVFCSPKKTEDPTKVYLLSENQTSIIANVPCVSSLQQLAENETIDQVVIVGSLSDCTQQVRDVIKKANDERKKLVIRLVDTQSQHQQNKDEDLLNYPHVVVDTEMVQSAASRCSILVNYLLKYANSDQQQMQLQEVEIRYYLLKIFFDICRNPNEIGLSDLESGSCLRYLCNDLKAAFLPFDRIDDSASSYPSSLSSSTTTYASGSSRSSSLGDSSNRTGFKIDTNNGGSDTCKAVMIEPSEIIQKIQSLHKPAVLDFLQTAGNIAANLGYDAYIAGGFVRDLLLGVLNQDIDLVVVGDGIAFADKLCEAVGTEVTHHREFGTAVVKLREGYAANGVCSKIDVATTRQEKYSKPATLPEVRPSSSIWYDLERRDFTFNAMGIRITPSHFGSIIDLVGGQEDLLKTKSLRTLHPWSFVDDPTRLFRAVRFEQRLGYSMGHLTSKLFEKSARLGFANRLSGARIARELQLILSEDAATSAIIRLEEFRLLSNALHSSLESIPEPALRRADHSLEFWKTKHRAPIRTWHVRFLALCSGLTDEVFEVVVKKLHLSDPVVKEFALLRAFPKKFLEWFASNERKPSSSKIYDMLNTLSSEGIVYLWAEVENEGHDCIERFASTLSLMKISINGNDLKKLGIPPGKAYAKLLKMTHDALLDGRVDSNRESQAEWVASQWEHHPEFNEFRTQTNKKS